MATVAVKYVGLLDVFNDHLYDTGEWIKGRPKPVQDWQAILLLKHTEFEDARSGKLNGQSIDAEPPEKAEEEVQPEDLAPLMNLESMTKDQLTTYAHRNFGIRLQGNKPEMVEKVQQLMARSNPGVKK